MLDVIFLEPLCGRAARSAAEREIRPGAALRPGREDSANLWLLPFILSWHVPATRAQTEGPVELSVSSRPLWCKVEPARPPPPPHPPGRLGASVLTSSYKEPLMSAP